MERVEARSPTGNRYGRPTSVSVFEELIPKGILGAGQSSNTDAVQHKLRFDEDVLGSKPSSSDPPPGFGRRRSKSQGQLRGGKSVYDLDYDPFGLDFRQEDEKPVDNRLAAEMPWNSGLDDLDAPDFSGNVRRKIASSFHVFEAGDDDELFSDSLRSGGDPFDSPIVGGRSRVQQLQQRPLSSLQFSSSGQRERAESDFGRYSSLQPHNRGIDEDIDRKAELRSQLRSPLGFQPQAYGHSHNQAVNDNGIAQFPINPTPNRPHSQMNMNRPPAGSNKNDWLCPSCGNTNYSWRHVCNMRKCRAPKPGHLLDPQPPGSWYCTSCGNLNYAERMVCNMRKCRAPRPIDHAVLGQLYGGMGNMGMGAPIGFSAAQPQPHTQQQMNGLYHQQQQQQQMYQGMSPKSQYLGNMQQAVGQNPDAAMQLNQLQRQLESQLNIN